MKKLTAVVCLGVVVLLGGVPLRAQMRNNTAKQMTCQNGGSSDRARHCEMREQTVAAVGRLNVDAGHNGGVTVKGWLQNSVLVRARVEAYADTESAAALLASKIFVDSSGGQVRATGPDSTDDTGWSVSFEVFVPQTSDLDLKSHNGGLSVSDVRGQIRLETHNGGVRIQRVAGDVTGSTHNGGIQIDLAGSTWDGRQLDLTTHNGGVTVSMPAQYSARLQAETRQGGIQSDFAAPAPTEGRGRPHRLDTIVGAGGPLIHVTTENGSVRFKRADTQ